MGTAQPTDRLVPAVAAREAILAELERRRAFEARYPWSVPQRRFLDLRGHVDGPILYLDLEGAVRAGKSTPAVSKLARYAIDFPGIQMAASRWSQDGLDAQVKPLWRAMAAAAGLRLKWHSTEEYDEVEPFGSRVYLRALKASDETARYSKFAGLTLAVIWIDQAEEVPEDVFRAYVPARLSQAGYPHECWVTPNPPGESHWIARMFPATAPLSEAHHYIHTSVYDNRAALGDAYLADLEAAYPPGTALRRRFVDGYRGLTTHGDPVYGGYFQRVFHVAETLRAVPDATLYEGWDFGHQHPAVVWAQYLPMGVLHLLGGVMGDAIFLEDFLPAVLEIRRKWFGQPRDLQSTGDPAGSSANSQGTRKSAADVLLASGISLQSRPDANMPPRRAAAIQDLARYMRRLSPSGPAFAVHPQFQVIGQRMQRTEPVLVDALEAGYVWDDRALAGTRIMRQPRKDGYYDHPMNAVEYIALRFGPRQAQEPLDEAPPPKADPFERFTRGRRGEAVRDGWMGS